MTNILKLSVGNAIGKAPKTTVVAGPEWIDAVPQGEWQVLPEVRVVAIDGAEPLSPEVLRSTEILVLEVDSANRASLDRLESVRRSRPDLPIVAAVERADIPLMKLLLHHDINDVVSLPFDIASLTTEIYNVGAKLADSETVLAPSICVTGAAGRGGATSILLHLANEFVHQADHPIRCCIIDLALQSGQLADYAGLKTSRSILSLLEADDRLDPDMLRNVATKSSEGVFVISAPSEILPMEQIDVDQVMRIVALARNEFDLVLIDMPPVWTNWSLSVAAESERIVMIVEQNLANLRQARRYLSLFREVGITEGNVDIVVNRAAKRRFVSITVQDVADTLGHDVIGTIREDRGELSQALDEGKLITQINRKNVFAQDVADLAQSLSDLIGEAD